MKHDVDLFLGLAQLSEKVALTALDELCAKRDRPAIEAFMEAFQLRPRMFPQTLSGEKMPLDRATTVIMSEPRKHQSTFDLVAMTVEDVKRNQPFSADQLAHFKKIVAFATLLKDAREDPFNRLGIQLSKHNTDPVPIQILAEAAKAAGKTLERSALAADAISRENYGAVLGILGHPDDKALIAALPSLLQTMVDGNSLGNWAWSLTQGVAGSPGHVAAHKLFDELEERVGVYDIAPLRLELLAAAIKLSMGTDAAHRQDDFLAVAGLTKPDAVVTESLCEALDALHEKEPTKAYDYVHSVLQANLVELLPSVGARIGEYDDSTRPTTGIGTALDGAFVWADGAEGARRLQETLGFMADLDHDLNNFGNGFNPMTHIAHNRRENRMKTLAVLLEMGFDPNQKDSANRLPEKYVCDEDLAAWKHVTNAHKARATAHTLLNEISLSP